MHRKIVLVIIITLLITFKNGYSQNDYIHKQSYLEGTSRILLANCNWGLLDEQGKQIILPKYQTIVIEKLTNAFLIIAKKGSRNVFWLYQQKKLVELPYDDVFKLTGTTLGVKSGDKYGLINTEGEGLALMRYAAIESINGDYLLVKIGEKFGVLNTEGKEILATQYDAIYNWNNKNWIVLKDQKFQVLNKKNKVIYTFDEVDNKIEISEKRLHLAIAKDKKWGLINAKGEELIAPQYPKLLYFGGEICAIHQTAGYMVLNATGKTINKEPLKRVEHTGGNYLVGGKTEGVALFHWNGTEIKLQNITDADAENWGVMAVQINNKWGLLDKEGELTIPANFDKILDLANEFAVVQEGELKGIYYDNGKEFKTPQYQDVRYLQNIGMAVQQNKKWGLLNTQGELEIPYKYDRIYSLTEEYLVVEQGKKVGIVDKTGKTVLKIAYESIRTYTIDFFQVQQNGKWFWVDKTGKVINCDF